MATQEQVNSRFLTELDFLSLELGRIATTVNEEEVVDLKTFLYSYDYLNLTQNGKYPLELSPRQFAFLEALDDDDPKTNQYLEAVIVWGKGSGKDWCTSIFYARRVYKLLCMKDPITFYGMPSGEPIDFLNVAASSDQAKDVFFNKFINLLEKAGPLAFQQFGFDFKKDIKDGKVRFPKNINVYSGHSERASLEGKNLYAAVMDEAAEFKTEAELKGKGHRAQMSAKAIYDFLSSSIRSRFPKTGKLILISYPRFKDDFILQRYAKGKIDPQTYTSFGSTFEVNPLRTVDDFAKDYRENPEQAKSMYECIPPSSDEPFIREQAKILSIVDFVTKPPHDIWGQYYPEFRGKPHSYTIGLDLSLTGDRTGFVMTHQEVKGGKNYVVIDLLKTWEAEQGKEIDIDSIKQEILFLRSRGFTISGIYPDQYQSALLCQQLQKDGFYVEKISIESKLEHWNSMKALIYNEELKVYNSENTDILIEELQGLTLMNGNKVDHQSTGTKDLCDALVRSIYGIIAKPVGDFVWKPF